MKLGDLDALRKNMEFICMGIMAGTEPYNAPLTEIDNTPTVDIKDQIAGAYNEGYACGSRENKRTQGEWNFVFDDKVNNRFIYKCSECGREVSVYSSDALIPVYPFCHCGADMRKGGGE